MRRKVRELMEGYLREILEIAPTEEEENAFVDSLGGDTYGIVTEGDGQMDYRLPFIHETWRRKWNGRTHIDMGISHHLMLDKNAAPMFIEFIRQRRKVGARRRSKYYHVTPSRNIRAIKRVGLRCTNGVVYLWDSQEHALEFFAAEAYPGEPLSVLEIDAGSSIQIQIDDGYIDGIDAGHGHAFYTFENIPPSRIRVLGKIRRGRC